MILFFAGIYLFFIEQKLLYSKIVGLVKKPMMKYQTQEVNGNEPPAVLRCIDLTYMNRLTKSDRALKTEIMTIYLKQTPPLIKTMKQSVLNKDWRTLYSVIHKMIPSFSVVGIHTDFESMAKKIQEYARLNNEDGQASHREQTERILGMVLQLEGICTQACRELKEELNTLNNAA